MTSELPFIKLSELSLKVGKAIEQSFANQSFWVLADVSNHSFKPQGNYHYFDLVEKDLTSNAILAKFSARAWGSGSDEITEFQKITGQTFSGGIHVLVNVGVNYHAIYGLQLNLLAVDPNFTLGALAQQRDATLTRLLRENPKQVRLVNGHYVTFNQELKLTPVIQRIAVITSQGSAGWQDFEHTLGNNRFGYRFEVDAYYTAVQGEHHASRLVDVLITIFNNNIIYQAVIIIRGGGAQSDFLIFDEYRLSRAIARFPIPVFTGIGHQKNETIADMMAHTSVKTPTKAAEIIIAHNRNFEEQILSLHKELVFKTHLLFSALSTKLTQLNNIVSKQAQEIIYRKRTALIKVSTKLFAQPKFVLSQKQQHLIYLNATIISYSKGLINKKELELKHLLTLINLMSPDSILKKGFAIVKQDEKIITDPDQIRIGGNLSIILAGTEIKTIVQKKQAYDGNDFKL